MAINAISRFLDRFRQSCLLRENGEQTDGQLLEAFIERRDARALEALVRRHAPMVWGVCRRTLTHHEAEDAFQSTFLVLVRRAASIRARELLAHWLYRVAYLSSRKARQMAAKRSARERQVMVMPEPQARADEDGLPELRGLLDEEMSRLPEKFRVVMVLCDLEGRSRPEVAQQLRLPEGTVGSRLARGRALLAQRLTRRGLGLSGTSVPAVWSDQASGAVAEALLTRMIKATGLMAAGHTATAGLLSTEVPPLTDAVLHVMAAPKWKAAAIVLLLAGLALGGVTVAYHPPASQPDMAKQPPELASQPNRPEQPTETSKVIRPDLDPEKYGTAAGARDCAKRYVSEHVPWIGGQPGNPEQGISRPWPSQAFDVTFGPKKHQWTVTGSWRVENSFPLEAVRKVDGRLDVVGSGPLPGKSYEWDWKLALSYNPSARGYEVQKAEGLDMHDMRPARMDDYGKWLQGRFTPPGRSTDPATTLRLVLDVPGRAQFGMEPKYSYGKDKMAVEPSPRGVKVSIGDPGPGGQAERWTLLFEASIAHSLKVGEYGGAWSGLPFLDVGPLIRVTHCPLDGGKQMWNSRFGEFVVREIELQDQNVVRLAIDFITDTEYGLPSTDKRDSRHIVRGSLRFNSRFDPSFPRLDADAAE